MLQDPAETEKGRSEDALRNPQNSTTSSMLITPIRPRRLYKAADGLRFGNMSVLKLGCDKPRCNAVVKLIRRRTCYRGGHLSVAPTSELTDQIRASESGIRNPQGYCKTWGNETRLGHLPKSPMLHPRRGNNAVGGHEKFSLALAS